MVNSTAFQKRLEAILRHYDLSATAFAEEIGVQRSSISHLLGGRNKPSLDFVLKVVQRFPEVNLYWLLNGKGSFPAKQQKTAPAPPKQPTQARTWQQSRTGRLKRSWFSILMEALRNTCLTKIGLEPS